MAYYKEKQQLGLDPFFVTECLNCDEEVYELDHTGSGRWVHFIDSRPSCCPNVADENQWQELVAIPRDTHWEDDSLEA
jgi:hypothetical protein